MAERTISTRLIVSGESAYRAAVKNINQELKTLSSALKLVDSNFKGQANTLAALEAKNKALNDALAKQTEKFKLENSALEQSKRLQTEYANAAQEARRKLAELAGSTDDATKETDEYLKTVSELQAEINKYDAAEQKAAAAVERHTQRANDAQVKLNDLNAELGKNQKYLNEARTSADGCAKSIDAMGKEMKDAGNDAEEFGDKSKDGIDTLASALAAAGVTATVKEIADALRACIDSSVEFESAMAGVAKTTDMSKEELADMGDSIKDLSLQIPLTTTELAGIAEVAGQLGIAKEDLLDFSTVMANLGVATNMTSEEAATMLAQFASITGMDASNFENLGSAIVALGNNFATNEQKITDMAQGIAGASVNAGMAETDMLALAAATTSLGIEAGMGGTNMSKLIGEMQIAVETGKDLDTWASAAGMSAKEFSALWGQDATAALSAFIGNLNHLDDSATVTLQSLGITEQRMQRMITSLANAEDKTGLLTKALNTSDNAWKSNNALLKEAETRYSTTESKIKLYENSVNNLKVAVGDQLTPALGRIVDFGKDINEGLARAIEENDAIVPLITGLVAAIGVLTVGITVATVATTAFGTALKAATAAMMTNPIFLAVTAVVALGVALFTAATNAENAAYSVKNLTEAARELPEAFEEADKTFEESTASAYATEAAATALIDRLAELEEKTQLTEAEHREWNAILAQLCETVPDLAQYINLETGEITGNTQALRDNLGTWKERALEEAKTQALQGKYKAYADAVAEVTKNQVELAMASKEAETAEQAHADIVERMDELMAQATEEAEKQAEQTGELVSVNADLIPGYRELEDALGDAASTMYEARDKVDDLTEAIGVGQETVGEYEAQMNAASDALDEMDATTAAENISDANQAIIDSLTPLADEIDNLTAKYQENYDAAYSNLTQTIGLFQEMDNTASVSVENMLSALDSQIKWMDDYSSNLDSLLGRNIEGIEEFALNFMDGSTESAAYLAGLKDATDEEIAQVIEKMKQSKEGTEALSTNIATAQTDMDGSLDDIDKRFDETIKNFNQTGAAFEAGAKDVQALIDGMNSKLGALESVSRRVSSLAKGSGYSGKTNGSYASGLDYVPYDGYVAELHKGERILTNLQARAMDTENRTVYRFNQLTENSANYNKTSVNETKVYLTVTNPSEAWLDYAMEKFNVKMGDAL